MGSINRTHPNDLQSARQADTGGRPISTINHVQIKSRHDRTNTKSSSKSSNILAAAQINKGNLPHKGLIPLLDRAYSLTDK